MNVLRKVKNSAFPKPAYSEDGRAQWPSRTSFLLASMGGAMGFGNMLRYPSQVYNNTGLQWFIPYLISLVCLAIPILILEISIGQAHRSGTVNAYNALDKRLRGVGLAMVWTGSVVAVYYVPMLSWTWVYFRHSFGTSFAWSGRAEEFFQEVHRQVPPSPGSIENGVVTSYASYSGTGVSGELIGWTILSYVIIWLCIYKGVSITGRVVYITIGLPIVMTVILLGRGVSLENADRGIKLYFAEWHSDKLAQGTIWQAACGQVFFSTGVGFGYFTAYASYNSQFASAVSDSIIIVLSNSLYEVVAAFIAFGVVGYLDLMPSDQAEPMGTYSLGFLTYPVAIDQMPAPWLWALLFFLTLILLGISSSYAMIDGLVTITCDSQFGRKFKHVHVVTGLVVIFCLSSFAFCTEFGYDLLNGTDAWANDIALLWSAWCEVYGAGSVYRWGDIAGQVGKPSFFTYNFGYLFGMIVGVSVGQAVGPAAGAGAGFGLYIVCTLVAILIAKTPDVAGPRFWGRNKFLNRTWWLFFYSGHQLATDLNVTVATGKNWSIPWIWGVCVRYIACPILAIVFSFSYPKFAPSRSDPINIWGFAIAHATMLFAIGGLLLPRFLNVWVPVERRGEGDKSYAPRVLLGAEDLRVHQGMEAGADSSGLDSGSDKIHSYEPKMEK